MTISPQLEMSPTLGSCEDEVVLHGVKSRQSPGPGRPEQQQRHRSRKLTCDIMRYRHAANLLCWSKEQQLRKKTPIRKRGTRLIARAALALAGYHQHKRGEWRERERRVPRTRYQATQSWRLGMMSAPKPWGVHVLLVGWAKGCPFLPRAPADDTAGQSIGRIFCHTPFGSGFPDTKMTVVSVPTMLTMMFFAPHIG